MPVFSCTALLSGVGISLCILFYSMAIKEISVGIAALLVYTGPVFAAAGEAVMQRRMPARRDAWLMLLSVMGIVLVTLLGNDADGGSLRGYGIGLLAGLCYAAYILLNRRIPAHIPLTTRTFWQFSMAWLLLLPTLFMTAQPFAAIETGWIYLLGIGIFQGFLGQLLVVYAVKRLRAIEFGTVSYLEPAVAVVMGWLVYNEGISPGQWLGFVLVLGASALQSLLPSSQRPAELQLDSAARRV